MNRNVFSILVFTAVAASGQTLDRAKPPVAPAPRPYKLPAVTETKLPNGLTVLMAEDARVPLATVRLVFLGGDKRDPKDLPGLAGSVSAMLMQGTTTRSFQQIAEQLDMLGGAVSTGTTSDAVLIAGGTLAENLPKLLEVVADVARNATFPENELALHKQNRKQAYLAQHARPDVLANEEFRRRVFGEHPYNHAGTTLAAIDKMDRGALTSWRDTYLVPNNAFLIVVGKLSDRQQLMKTVTAQFGSWQQKALPEYKPEAPPASKRQLVLVDRPGSVQADVQMGKLSPAQNSSEYFPEAIGSMILGGPASRLFMDIREKRGFAYDVHTELNSAAEAGTFSVVTQIRNDVAAEALQGIIDHMQRMGAEPVTRQELSDAKSYGSGRYLLRLEAQSGLADQLVQMKAASLPKDYLETYVTKLNSTEPDQIQNAGKKYMSPEDDAVIVVGDAAKLQPLLEKVGKFEVVKPN